MEASQADVEAGVAYDILFAGDKVGVGMMLEDGSLSGEFEPAFILAVYGQPVSIAPAWGEGDSPELFLELTIEPETVDLHGEDGEDFPLEPPC